MRKRICAILFGLLLLLLPVWALADNTDGHGDLMIESEGVAAYVDGNGSLLIPGHSTPINTHPADAIVAINPYRVVFLGASETGSGQDLMAIDFSTYAEQVIAENVYAATATDSDTLYYTLSSDRAQLYQVSFDQDRVVPFHTFSESIEGLYRTLDGLVVSFVEDAGSVIWSQYSATFEPYGNPLPVKSVVTEDCEVYIADGSSLFVRRQGSTAADYVDQNVFDFALQNGVVYYVANTGSAVRIKRYDPLQLEQRVVCTPEEPLTGAIAASRSALFVLGSDDQVYRVNVSSGALTPVTSLQNPPVSASKTVDSWKIYAASGLMNAYAQVVDAQEAPALMFIEFTTDLNSQTSTIPLLVEGVPIEGEDPAWTILQPAVQYSPLMIGSRGDAVRAIQQPLYDHGYYDYYIDGIFGYRTENAVRTMQGDLGRRTTGIADSDLQTIILSGNFPNYDPYSQISYGDRGDRVMIMQLRLRVLGYLADDADGIFGRRTQAAVQLFQQENGITQSSHATRDTLARLFAADTPQCSSYIPLYLGDSGYRVRDMNKRLKDLYYLSGSVTDTFTNETARAIRRFQAQVGLNINGEASVMLQQRLFAVGAPECSGYIPLYRGDENARVARLQRRLKELGYYTGSIDGYFGKATQEAVKLFQRKVGMRPTGTATIAMQELLFSPNAPVYVKPTVIGNPVITLDGYAYRQNGVYYVHEESAGGEYITLMWAAEGDVLNYGVRLTDENGKEIFKQNTDYTMTSLALNQLDLDRVYVFTVTAYPEDGDSKHVTNASIRFARIEVPVEPEPAIGIITQVSASVDPVSLVEDEIYFVRPGTITLRWYAEGDLQEYYIEVRDSRNNLVVHNNTIEESATLSTDSMQQGERYTLCVYAIPENGSINDATLKTLFFQLEEQKPVIPTVTAPEVTVENAEAVDGIYQLNGETVTLTWFDVENAAQYYIELRDPSNALVANDTTIATDYTLSTGALAAGGVYTITVTAIPELGAVEDGAATVVNVELFTDEPQPAAQLDAPEIRLDNAEISEDGIAYTAEPELTFRWDAVDEADGYNLVLRDSNGSIITESTESGTSFRYDASAISRGAVYTCSVTAIPDEGSNAQGTPSSIAFVLEDDELDMNFAEPEEPAEEEGGLGLPQLSVEPTLDVVDDVYEVEPGQLVFRWSAEGDVARFNAVLQDDNGTSIAEVNTEQLGAQLQTAAMEAGRIYTLNVTAIPADDQLSATTASIRFTFHEDEEPGDEEPIEEEPVEEDPVQEEPVEEQSIDEAPQPEDSVEAPAEEPVEETPADADIPSDEDVPAEEGPAGEEPAEPKVGRPTISLDPMVYEQDGIAYVSPDGVTFSWSAEGDVSLYRLEIFEGDASINSMDTDMEYVKLATNNMTPGAVYEFRVTAIPSSNLIEESASASLLFSLAEDEAEAPYEEPEPTEEPYEEPEPTEEPWVEPTEEPWTEPEPTEEPWVEPTEEPWTEPEPTEEPWTKPTEEPWTEPEPTEEPYVEPEPTEEPYVEPEPTEEPYVEPEPTEEPYVEPEPTEAPASPWSSPLTPNSDPSLIAQVQQKLVNMGLLEPGSYESGVLDAATIEAIAQYQEDFLGNVTISEGNPSVSTATLQALMG